MARRLDSERPFSFHSGGGETKLTSSYGSVLSLCWFPPSPILPPSLPPSDSPVVGNSDADEKKKRDTRNIIVPFIENGAQVTLNIVVY